MKEESDTKWSLKVQYLYKTLQALLHSKVNSIQMFHSLFRGVPINNHRTCQWPHSMICINACRGKAPVGQAVINCNTKEKHTHGLLKLIQSS